MFYSHVLVFFATCIQASMIVRMPTSIRRPQTVKFIATTLKKSRAVLRSDSKMVFQETNENYGFELPDEHCDTAQRQRFGPSATEPGFLRKMFPSFCWHLLPNWLTYFRCAAIPMLIVFFYSSQCNAIPSGIFAVASATDYLDGYLARRWDITSDFGAFLDPVADKLMVSTALILLAGRYGAPVAIPTSIILAREIAVSALREWMSGKGLRNLVQVGFQGKLKTATTMLSLTLLLLVPAAGARCRLTLQAVSLLLLYLSTFITVTSGSLYFIAAAPFLNDERNVG